MTEVNAFTFLIGSENKICVGTNLSIPYTNLSIPYINLSIPCTNIFIPCINLSIPCTNLSIPCIIEAKRNVLECWTKLGWVLDAIFKCLLVFTEGFGVHAKIPSKRVFGHVGMYPDCASSFACLLGLFVFIDFLLQFCRGGSRCNSERENNHEVDSPETAAVSVPSANLLVLRPIGHSVGVAPVARGIKTVPRIAPVFGRDSFPA